MKKLSIITSLLLASTVTFAFDLNSFTNDVIKSVSTDTSKTTSNKSDLTNPIISDGLKKALIVGINYAIKELGSEDGYLSNPSVKIPLPQNLAKVETLIRTAGGEKLADDLINSMNNAASKAAPKTAEIFLDAVNNMNLKDAKEILEGDENAATNYFSKHTTSSLKKMIIPIIRETMKENNVATYYNTINTFYKENAKELVNSSSLMNMAKSYGVDSYLPGSSDMNIDEYVTNKAIDGLFKMIALKEAQIRKNPVEQTTSILKQVFGK